MKDRLNRCRIEWQKFLTAVEYVLLDKILFQSNLTEANKGQGFIFHVRTLEKECNIARSAISRTLDKWPFMVKKGTSKAMTIQMDYAQFESWIVRMGDNNKSDGVIIVPHRDNKAVIVPVADNDCPSKEPRSKSIEVKEINKSKQGAVGLTDSDIEALSKETGFSKDQIRRIENEFSFKEAFGKQNHSRSKPSSGFDSLG